MILHIPHDTRPKNDAEAILLAELQAATAITKERRRGHWIPIHSKQWRNVLGSRYKATIRAVIEAGYVEANDRYSVGRFAKSYRLAERYRRPKTQGYMLRRDFTTAARIRIDKTDSVGQLLVEQFTRFRLTGTASGWDGFCAAQIRRGLYYATRCQHGRFHTSFTGLRRRVRSQLRVDEQRLVELDIANCQPLILGVIAARNSRHNNHHHTPHHTHTHTHIPYVAHF